MGLPKGLGAKELAKRAKEEENLVVAEGGLFEVPGDNVEEGTRFDDCIRLCFTFEEEGALSVGVERLGRVIGSMLKGEEVSEKVENDGNEKDGTNAFW